MKFLIKILEHTIGILAGFFLAMGVSVHAFGLTPAVYFPMMMSQNINSNRTNNFNSNYHREIIEYTSGVAGGVGSINQNSKYVPSAGGNGGFGAYVITEHGYIPCTK